MEHLLLTGGTGLIGRALAVDLLATAAPPRITVLTRQAQPALPAGADAIRDLAALRDGPPVDAVVNLAGEPLADRRWSAARKLACHRSRVDLTTELLAALDHQPPPKVLVSGSAVGWYGPRQGTAVLDETSTAEPGSFSHRLCSAWEAAAMPAAQRGTRVVLLRTGVVLARQGGMLAKLLPLFRLGLGGRVGHGQQWLSWIHLADMVGLLRHALANTIEGAVNATAPEPVTNATFTRQLAEALGRPALLPAPATMLRLAYGEMADELLLAGQRVMPTRAMESGYRFQHPTLAAALADLVAQ